MTDKSDVDQYKCAYSKIQLTQKQKSILIAKVIESNESVKNNLPENCFYNLLNCILLRKVVPCLLVAVLFLTGIFVYTNYINSKNTFAIVASAAELQEGGQNEAVIGVYSDSGYSGFEMCDFDYKDENNALCNKHLLNEQGKIDYFNFFTLSELNIVGKNIESVTFKANKRFTYFYIEPLYHDEKQLEEILEMFSDYDSIDNSQYPNGAGDGIFAETGRCDAFTYKNPNITGEEQTINLGDYLEFVVESDRTDDEIDAAVDEIEEVYLAYDLVLDSENKEAKSVKVSDKSDEELENQLGKNTGVLCKKTLEGATIDITAKFTDGSTQTKVINVDFYQKVEKGVYDSPKIILSCAN